MTANPDVGNSYISFKRKEWTRSDHSTITTSFPLLDTAIAPVEKQLRVFVDGVEYTYDDPTLISRPTTNKWTYAAVGAAPSVGARCWGVRFQFDPVGDGLFDDPRTCCLAVFDENLSRMTDLDETYGDDGGTFTEAEADALLDLDTSTGWTGSGTASYGNSITYIFPEPRIVSRMAWGRNHTGGNSDLIENMRVQVNTGTLASPNWVTVGDNATHAVGNSQDSHAAGEELDSSDYPSPTTPIDPLTELLWFDLTDTGFDGTDLQESGLFQITLDPAPAVGNDRVVLLRETRQDRPWVRPTPSAYAHPESIMVYFEQIRYIVQELCELPTVAQWMPLGISDLNQNPYTGGSQAHFHLNRGGSSAGPFSYADVELLSTIPGANLNDRHQIVVERGNKTDGTSESWTTLQYDATPADEDQYSLDSSAKTITLGDVEDKDLRIRRVTKTDEWWYDPRGGSPGWTSLGIDTMQKQARFMIEEACYLPQWFKDSPLSTSIFPRSWNWFVFVGTRNQWTIPGGVWGGNGEVEIFVNDVEQTEGTEYTIEWPTIVWTGGNEPADDDTTVIGVGSGGWGGSLGGGEDDEETPSNPATSGGNQGEPVDWPGLDIPVDCGFSLSIGSTPQSSLSSGSWEGGISVSFLQGNSTSSEFGGLGSSVMRIQATVTTADTISDGVGGYLPVGATEVLYVNKKCNGTLYRVCLATSLTGDAPWTADDASEALGCLVPTGASGGLDIFVNRPAACIISSSSPVKLRMLDGLLNTSIEDNLASFVPGMSSYLELQEQAADALEAGVTAEDGFSGDQFDQYLDPDQDFTDFDIPAP